MGKVSAIAVVLLLAAAAFAQRDPATLPARDAHDKLVISADPLLDPARYKERFGKKSPYQAGIVAIEVFVKNDNDRPVRLMMDSIRLIVAPPGGDRQKLEALAPEDVADRMINKGGPNPTVSRRPWPTTGTRSGKRKEVAELAAELRSVSLQSDVIPPRTMSHGFVYFDVDRNFDAIAHSRLYIPELKFLDDQKPLLYFEIDLSAAAPR